MRYSVAVAVTAFLAQASAHGVVTEIQGANGVNMPALSVADGTPRSCATPSCGAEADTSIIRDNELGTTKATALGRTNGGGPVSADAAISMFMGGSSANSSSTSTSSTKASKATRQLSALLGGGSSSSSSSSGSDATGTKTAEGASESGVSAAAGKGAASGMPTAGDDGTLSMTFHQVNQDGAGPLSADVDSTSGGTDPNAFQAATVSQNVPGLVAGLSATTTTDFPIKAAVPSGTVCSGSAGGANNVCVMRLRNQAAAGPFGGSVAFTQTASQRKRAIEYRLKARGLHVARGLVGKADLE